MQAELEIEKIPFPVYLNNAKEEVDMFLFLKNFVHPLYAKYIWKPTKE